MNKTKQVSIVMPGGVGDMHWVMVKLESWKKFNGIQHLDVAIFKDMRHNSARQFLEMISFVDSVSLIEKPAHFFFDRNPLHTDPPHASLSIEFNSCLESGQRIEAILPGLDTDFDYDLTIPEKGEAFASEISRSIGGHPALLYVSCDAMNTAWPSMKPTEWAKILNGLGDITGVETCVIGSEWDRDFSEKVMRHAEKSAYINLIGKTDITVVLALIRQAPVIVGFPSGLPVIATKLGTPSIMFWPTRKWNKEFRTCWVEPSVLDAGAYKAIDFQTEEAKPEHVLSCALDMITSARSV